MTTLTAVEPTTERGIERIIGQRVGRQAGPTLICVGSMHGNEPAGRLGVARVFAKLAERGLELKGELVGLVGNRAAVAKGTRFVHFDLNRHFKPPRLQASIEGELADSTIAEDRELDELRLELAAIAARARGPVFFLDLHTTSGKGYPFAVMSDTLRNREFALHFPVPIIVGLEEELEGTLSEFVGCLGHVAVGFEGGQHDDPESIELSEAAVWIALASAGLLPHGVVPEEVAGFDRLRATCKKLPPVFEVRYRQAIKPEDGFVMEPGFASFDEITKGQLLARGLGGREYRAREQGHILMPLYQKQGEDGYFEVRTFSPFWLRFSKALRHLRVDHVLHWLPGVRRHEKSPDALVIDRRVARFLTLQISHLLGFRRHRSAGERFLVVTRQQRDFGATNTCEPPPPPDQPARRR